MILDRILNNEEVRCAPVIRIPLGSSAELVYLPLRKTAYVLTPRESALLRACSCFSSLADHAKQIISRLPSGSAGAPSLMQILQSFEANGMMLSHNDLVKRLGEIRENEAPPRISWFAIPTCNRSGLLRRALMSYGEHFAQSSHFPTLLVVDDSLTPQANRLSLEVVNAQTVNWGADIVYMGLEEKRRLIDRLSEKDSLPREVLEFGILGSNGITPTMGANRNTILLQTAGHLLLSVDDDTLCKPLSPPGCDPNTLLLGSESDPTEFWFFPDRESTLSSVGLTNVEILAAHEELLGRGVWALYRGDNGGAGGRADLGAACTHLLLDILNGSGSVRITLNGSVGDSGMYSGRSLLVQKQSRTRQRLTESEDCYRSATRSREVVRQASAVTVCHGSPLMAMFLGIDNRCLLPPFFPVGRNEDGIFALLIGRFLKGAYCGYLPWSLLHDPTTRRSYCPHAAATVRISDLVLACISTCGPLPDRATTGDRLRRLGHHLISLASSTPDDFQEFLRMVLWNQAAQLIAGEEAMIEQYEGQPDYWVADLREDIETRQRAMVKPDYPVPIDLPGTSTNESLRNAQDLIRRYGELLTWWPAITERARELATSGRSTATRDR